jgi:hypothetical protein
LKYRKLSKSLSKKTKGSKGYEKARLKIAKFHAKLKDTRNYFLHKLSTEMSVKTKQLFYRYEKFLEWLRIGNYGELASETRLENIQNIFRMDLRKNMVMISE